MLPQTSRMNRNSKDDRVHLSAIAHRVMIERGMEPDFSTAVKREVAEIDGPAEPADGARDLRELCWASIDNDDSDLRLHARRRGGRYGVCGGRRTRRLRRRVAKSAAALLMSGKIGATFDASVTGVSAKGTWVGS